MDSFPARWQARAREFADGLPPERMIPIGGSFLPESAAPFLSFRDAAHPTPVCQVFGIPADWTGDDRARLERFAVIGVDGEGNPICLDADGTVVRLDHEDRFTTSLFVNSSLSQLSECLLAYFGETDPERFRSRVTRIDARAIEPNGFWWQEAGNLAPPD